MRPDQSYIGLVFFCVKLSLKFSAKVARIPDKALIHSELLDISVFNVSIIMKLLGLKKVFISKEGEKCIFATSNF